MQTTYRTRPCPARPRATLTSRFSQKQSAASRAARPSRWRAGSLPIGADEAFPSGFSWQGWFQNFQQSFLLLLAPGWSACWRSSPAAPTCWQSTRRRRCTASSADVGRSLTIGRCSTSRSPPSPFRRRCWPAWRSPPSPAAARLAWQSALGAVMAMLFTAATVISVLLRHLCPFDRRLRVRPDRRRHLGRPGHRVAGLSVLRAGCCRPCSRPHGG